MDGQSSREDAANLGWSSRLQLAQVVEGASSNTARAKAIKQIASSTNVSEKVAAQLYEANSSK